MGARTLCWEGRVHTASNKLDTAKQACLPPSSRLSCQCAQSSTVDILTGHATGQHPFPSGPNLPTWFSVRLVHASWIKGWLDAQHQGSAVPSEQSCALNRELPHCFHRDLSEHRRRGFSTARSPLVHPHHRPSSRIFSACHVLVLQNTTLA